MSSFFDTLRLHLWSKRAAVAERGVFATNLPARAVLIDMALALGYVGFRSTAADRAKPQL